MFKRVMASPRYYRYPAQVLGCLATGEITLILGVGLGMANGGRSVELPIHLIPADLRMPNSEFDVLFDRHSRAFTEVLRKGELHLENG